MCPRPPRSQRTYPPFPYTARFRSCQHHPGVVLLMEAAAENARVEGSQLMRLPAVDDGGAQLSDHEAWVAGLATRQTKVSPRSSASNSSDRKSTRLNSSH